VLTHLNNGEIDDAITRFAEEFTFKDHGGILPEGAGTLPRLFAADSHNFREWRSRNHRMDA